MASSSLLKIRGDNMAEKSMVAKLILDATTYQKGIAIAKSETIAMKKELELWAIQNNVSAGSLKALARQSSDNAATQKILTSEISRTKAEMAAISGSSTEYSAKSATLKNKLLDLQIQQAKLNKEIGGGLTPLQNFKNGMAVTATQLQKVGEKMTSAGKAMTIGLTAPIIAAGAGILKLANDAAAYADTLGVMSEKTGMSLKSLQEMQFVTNQLDIDFTVVQDSMAQFTNKLKGVEKGSGDSAAAMKALGISMEDSSGKTRPISEVYNDVIKKLSGMKNESDRNILASALFGKSWQNIAPMLKAGSAEIERLKKQAHDLGLVLSDESINKARAFGDQMDALKMQFKVAGTEIGTAFMPILTDSLIPFIQGSVVPAVKAFAGHIAGLIEWFKGLSPELQKTIGFVAGLVVSIGPALIIIGKLTTGISLGIKAFSALFSPITLIIIAIVALAAYAYVLVKNWDKVVPFFDSVWKLIKSAFATGGAGIMVVVREIQLGLAKFLDFTAGNLLALYSGLFGFLSKIPGIGGVFAAAQSGIDGLRNSLKGFVLSSEEDLSNAKANIKGAASGTAEAFGTMTRAASELGKGMGNTIQDSVEKVKGIFKSIPVAAKTLEPAMNKSGKGAADAYTDGIKLNSGKAAEAAKDMATKAADAAKKAQDEIISNVNKLNSTVLSALKRRYDAQKTMDDNAIRAELTNLDKWKNEQLKQINTVHDAMITSLDAETKLKSDAIQAQIDLLDTQQNAEADAKTNKQELDNIAGLQGKFAAETDATHKLQIQSDLNNAMQSRTERLHIDEINAQKDALRKQIDELRTSSDNRKNQLDYDLKNQTDNFNATYDAEKLSLDTRKTNLDKFYTDKESAASLNAEAEKLIMSNNQIAINTLLNTYGSLYEDSGQTLGERFFTGFKTWANQVAALVKNAASGMATAGGAVAPVTSKTQALDDAVLRAKKSYTAAQASGDTAAMAIASKAAATARGQGATIGYISTDDAIKQYQAQYGKLPSYDVGTPYVPQDMIAQIHKGEAIIPAAQNRGGTGGVNVIITGNNISSGRDTEKLLDDMVRKLKQMGIRIA